MAAQRVEIPSPAGHGKVRSYFVRPAGEARQIPGGRYERHLYPGTQHGFHDDTTPRYDEAAAKLAWERTVAFFDRHLKG